MSVGAAALRQEADDELLAKLAGGDDGALRTLHRRYAALVFTVAARIVDAARAEEVVQDVFLTIWKKHELFDPSRGSFTTWLRQLTRNASLNVLRAQRSDRGAVNALDDSHSDRDAEIADDAVPVDEALWIAHRQSVLRAAVDALPDGQREALSLAYFDELTQEQVAAVLRVPLGTTKTRIRTALRRLAPVLAVAIGAGLVVLFVSWRRARDEARREERALTLVTSSDVVPLRLEAAPGVPAEAHANYRARAGGTIAVLTASHLPPLSASEHYAAWVRADDTWSSLGTIDVRPDGSALRVVEDGSLGRPVVEVEITREADAASAPHGPPVVVWRAR